MADEEPHYLGHRDRLRERFAHGGADALPDYERSNSWLLAKFAKTRKNYSLDNPPK